MIDRQAPIIKITVACGLLGILAILASSCSPGTRKVNQRSDETETKTGTSDHKLRVGAFTASTSVTSTSFVLNWTAATTSDDASPSNKLEYYLCSASSAAQIDTIAECESAKREMNWRRKVTTFNISSKSPNTTYHYNLIVRDTNGTAKIYAAKSQKTLLAGNEGSTATIAPSTTATNAERSGIIRHSFYDTLNARHWQFFVDGSTIKSQYSTNGAAWVAATNLTATVTKFTVHYKSISGTAYVFLVSEESSHDILLRRGSLSTTSITWDSAVTVFNGTS